MSATCNLVSVHSQSIRQSPSLMNGDDSLLLLPTDSSAPDHGLDKYIMRSKFSTKQLNRILCPEFLSHFWKPQEHLVMIWVSTRDIADKKVDSILIQAATILCRYKLIIRPLPISSAHASFFSSFPNRQLNSKFDKCLNGAYFLGDELYQWCLSTSIFLATQWPNSLYVGTWTVSCSQMKSFIVSLCIQFKAWN
jgi:hypothetical protein